MTTDLEPSTNTHIPTQDAVDSSDSPVSPDPRNSAESAAQVREAIRPSSWLKTAVALPEVQWAVGSLAFFLLG